MFAWDDIAVFLALYRERTTGRAAKALGCSQPTVVRRIASLEHAIGLALFDRSPSGLTPTAAANSLASAARHVEHAVCEFESEVDLLVHREIKRIRLTMVDHFEQLMVPVLREFRSRWPAVQTELMATDRIHDLARGEADIAIRGNDPAATDELVARDLPPSGWTIYASSQIGPKDRPRSADEVGSFPLAMLGGPPGLLPIYIWLKGVAEGREEPPLRCSNLRAMSSVIASGAAISALPCTMGDGDPQLVRCFPPDPAFDVPIYLVARRAILRRPPARDLFESIAAYFWERPTLLTGKRD